MTQLIELRDRIRKFIIAHELVFARVVRFVLTLWALYIINSYFGYAQLLRNPIIWLVVSALCAFVPISGSAVALNIYLLVEIYTLSAQAAAATFVLMVMSYILSAYYGSRHTHNNIFIPLGYQIQIPFAMPMVSGLVGGINEVTSIVCGSILSFYLAMIRRNASTLLDTESGTSVTDLIVQNMFGNKLFYIYLVTMIVMFLVVYNIRERVIHRAWDFAVLFGTLVEFVMMMAGYMYTGNSSRIPALILANVAIALIGFAAGFMVKGFDYSRIEKVQFEDDDYYYYVTAVPKIHLEEEEKKVTTITEGKKTE